MIHKTIELPSSKSTDSARSVQIGCCYKYAIQVRFLSSGAESVDFMYGNEPRPVDAGLVRMRCGIAAASYKIK